jgi:hypothetical protein
MAKSQITTVRTTISVRRDLKRRMDKAEEPVNWSGLAAEAFERKLAEIETKKENPLMAEVIERLRVSKRESETQEFQTGWDQGKEWAEKHAEFPELERLANWRNDPHVDQRGRYELTSPGRNAFGPAEHLAFTLQPEDQSRSGAQDFWNRAVKDDAESRENITKPEFLRGFVEGALDVWDKAKDQL